MPAQIPVTRRRPEARRGEDRLHVIRLAGPDFDQHMPVSRQVAGSARGNVAIGIEAVCASYKCEPGVEVPDVGAEPRHIGSPYIGWI